jgi:molecular chaperone DnaK (HSP70)
VDARFIIGIDLGTTNCALADVDTSAGDEASPAVQGIAQLINPGEVAAPTLLPSFLFCRARRISRPGRSRCPGRARPTR